MTPAQFLKHFAPLTDTEGGVKKLRNLILQLAVQGKLVEQDPNDEPAAELVTKILTQQKDAVKQKLIRKSKPLPPIDGKRKTHTIPKNWTWIYFGDLGDWGAGATPSRSEYKYFGGPIKWFKSGELNEGIIHDSEETITELALQDFSLRMNKPGDVLIAMYGATIGKVAILGCEATTNQAVCACTCFDGVFNRYLMLLLKAYKSHFISKSAGAAQPNFSKEKIVREPAPLPPLAEQKRIVAKVDELMRLCDELEARQTEQRAVRVRMSQAALEPLTQAADQGQFASAWRRLNTHFDTLFARPESLAQLRQTLLQLAVMGKLVEQDESDEPANLLLERISQHKGKLIARGDIPNQREPKPLNGELISKLPKGWTQARFGNICLYIEAGSSPKCETRPRVQNEWGVLKISAVTWDVFNPEENKALPANLEPRTKDEVKSGDFIMSRANTAELVAKSVVVEKTPPRLLLNDKLLRVEFPTEIDKKYINLFNNSFIGRTYFASVASGTSTSMRNVSRENVANIIVNVPPANEQKRIVKRVQELMALCDTLEAQLARREASAEGLLEAMVAAILNGGGKAVAAKPSGRVRAV